MNEKIIAVCSLSAFLAIGITNIEYGIDDKITTIFMHDSGKNTNKRTTKVHYDVNGDGYIIRYKTKYYLDEFIKTKTDF